MHIISHYVKGIQLNILFCFLILTTDYYKYLNLHSDRHNISQLSNITKNLNSVLPDIYFSL